MLKAGFNLAMPNSNIPSMEHQTLYKLYSIGLSAYTQRLSWPRAVYTMMYVTQCMRLMPRHFQFP